MFCSFSHRLAYMGFYHLRRQSGTLTRLIFGQFSGERDPALFPGVTHHKYSIKIPNEYVSLFRTESLSISVHACEGFNSVRLTRYLGMSTNSIVGGSY